MVGHLGWMNTEASNVIRDYVEWFRDNKQKIEDGMGFKGGVLGLRHHLDAWGLADVGGG